MAERKSLGFLVGALSALVLTPVDAGAPAHDAAPDFVDVAEVAPGAIFEIRYAGTDNFVGAPIDGYEAARCLLLRPAAEALGAVQARLEAMGLALRIYDCYRPQRAVDHFVRWAADLEDTTRKDDYYPNTAKSVLFAEGYIAERSGHTRGATVDLTIDGLDMGGPWDFFDPVSHTANPDVPIEARANRLLLKAIMEAEGFRNYEKEWWHYTLEDEPHPDRYFDAPITPAD